jgi:ATP-dependent DNA ligase
MLFRSVRPRSTGFIEPGLPSLAPNPPTGRADWIHEMKLDGFRLLARRPLRPRG